MIERHSPVGESGYFASSAEYGLYLKALDWCLREAGRYLPAEWVIPEWVIAGWGQRRTANQLAATGIWEHDPYEHVYRFRYVYRRNTPRAFGRPARRAAKRRPGSGWPEPMSPGDKRQCPPGIPPGTTDASASPRRVGMYKRKPSDQQRHRFVPRGHRAPPIEPYPSTQRLPRTYRLRGTHGTEATCRAGEHSRAAPRLLRTCCARAHRTCFPDEIHRRPLLLRWCPVLRQQKRVREATRPKQPELLGTQVVVALAGDGTRGQP